MPVVDSGVTAATASPTPTPDASIVSVMDAATVVPPPPASHDAGQPTYLDAGRVSQAPEVDGGTVVPPGIVDAAAPVAPPLPSDGNRGSVCYVDRPCAKDLFCFAPTGGGVQYPGVCTDGCRTNANCAPIDGIAQICGPNGQCQIDCAGMDNKGTGACPTNEVCRDTRANQFTPSVWRCTFPDSSGSRASPIYGACSTQHGGGDCALPNVCYVPSAAFQLPVRGQLPTATLPSTAGYCTSECAMAMDCPVNPGTTAVPVCNKSRCELDCGAAGANTCPDKMNCRDIDENPLTTVFRCIYLN